VATRAGFGDGFLWGTATSAHQVEGNNQGNDWWEWEQRPGKIKDGSTSGKAAQWWQGRAEEDLARGRELGQNAHRLSLEWSRLEPEPGRWDDAAFARYRELFRAARALGLKLLVTVNHFTLPAWLARRGGWLAREAPAEFAELARRAALAFGSEVELWCTQNEPNVLALMAYADERWPPGLGSLSAAFRSLATMLDAHVRAYRAIHAVLPSARVGLVLNLPILDPARPRLADRAVARLQDWAFSGALLHALETGIVFPPLAPFPARVPGLTRALDWLGVNYYGRYSVTFDAKSGRELFGRRVGPNSIRTEWNDWGEPWPAGLTEQLVRLGRFHVPLYVTENGVMDASDRVRPEFLREHVHAVGEAIARGSDVRGYFHWSLLDNFEWSEGWSAPFGLHALDRATQARTLRESGALYARICRANGVEQVETPPRG
jgi:beta-glucosidase